jgi:hypothetical protein
VDYFDRQHTILWDIVVHDTVGPVAFLALAIWALAVVARLHPVGPVGPLIILFFTVGAMLHVVSDLTYLSLERIWRSEGFRADPPGPMNSIGAAVDAVDLSTTYLTRSHTWSWRPASGACHDWCCATAESRGGSGSRLASRPPPSCSWGSGSRCSRTFYSKSGAPSRAWPSAHSWPSESATR